VSDQDELRQAGIRALELTRAILREFRTLPPCSSDVLLSISDCSKQVQEVRGEIHAMLKAAGVEIEAGLVTDPRDPPETLVRQCLETGTDLGLSRWQLEGAARLVGGMMRREHIRSLRQAGITSEPTVTVYDRLRNPTGPCSTCGQEVSVYCWECRYFWMEARWRKARNGGLLFATALAVLGFFAAAILLLLP
jgi:hypothetical protein